MNIPKTDSTTISYYRIGEFEKYRLSHFKSDSLIYLLKSEVNALDSVSGVQRLRLDNFEKVTIPTLRNKYEGIKKDLDNSQKILTIKEGYFKGERKRLRRGKLSFGIVGVAIGIVTGLLII